MVAQALAAQGGLVLEMPNEPLATAPLPLPAMLSLAAAGPGGAGDAGAGSSQLLQLPEVNPRTQPPLHGHSVGKRGWRSWPGAQSAPRLRSTDGDRALDADPDGGQLQQPPEHHPSF